MNFTQLSELRDPIPEFHVLPWKNFFARLSDHATTSPKSTRHYRKIFFIEKFFHTTFKSHEPTPIFHAPSRKIFFTRPAAPQIERPYSRNSRTTIEKFFHTTSKPYGPTPIFHALLWKKFFTRLPSHTDQPPFSTHYYGKNFSHD